MTKESKVLLRPPIDADSSILFDWINNHDLVIKNAPYKHVSLESHQAWFKSILQPSADRYLFMIEVVESRKTIGSCQLLNIHPIHRSADLQIRIGEPNYHGKGYGTDALQQLISFGFNTLKLHRISLTVFSNNLRAINAYKKVGFNIEGCMKDAACIDSQFLDVVIMGKINSNE